MPKYYNYKLLTNVTLVIMLVWTLLLGFFAYSNISHVYQYADDLALQEARVSVKKDFAYRSWVASHGGVYVPVTKRTPPNPNLSHIPNRDVTTDDGQKLTLMNPAYTLRQMMQDYTKLYGIKSKITSTKLLNPINAPDAWEEKALGVIKRTREPFYEKKQIEEKAYLRYLNPLEINSDCLKCHAYQGYEVGDIRGGVSVSVPLADKYGHAWTRSVQIAASFGAIWLLGLGFIYYGFVKIRQSISAKVKLYEQNIYMFVDLIEQRDSYTAGHSKRVAYYCQLIAKEMGYDRQRIDTLYRAAMLHDIGKISTPDSVLLKPGRLDNSEYALIRQHPVAGYDILKNLDIFEGLAGIVRHHHERYDGGGYPDKLQKEQVSMDSYIMAAADAFDAMTTDRIYKPRESKARALEELERFSGSQFHPEVAKAAVKALKNVKITAVSQQIPQTQLEKVRFAYFYFDQLTGVYNREYLKFILLQQAADSSRYNCAYGIYLHNVTAYNKKYGWNAGDKMLQDFAAELKKRFPYAVICRLFGDDFILLHPHHEEFGTDDFASLQGKEVTVTHRHIDLHGLRPDIDELETMLKD